MFSWFWGATTIPSVKEKKEETSFSPEYLRKRGKLLYEIDHSWRAKLNCFECLGMENARVHAGFTDSKEIIAIQRQLADDKREQRKAREAQLRDDNYLSKRYSSRAEVDDSWTALFCGTAYARRKAGFDSDENAALDDYASRKFGFFSSLFSRDNPNNKATKPKFSAKGKATIEVEKRQRERKQAKND